MISQRKVERTLTSCLVTATLCLVLTASVPAKARPAIAAGKLQMTGQVTVNGIGAAPGATVLSRSRIRTGADGIAQVIMGRQGRIEIGPGSEIVLQLTDSAIGGKLLRGRALVSAASGTSISLAVAEAAASTDGAHAAVLIGALDQGLPRIAAAGSGARVASGDRSEFLTSGQEAIIGRGEGGRSGPEIRIGSAGETFSRTLSSRTVSNPGIAVLLRDSISRAGGTVSGTADRPTGGRDLPTRDGGRQPDTRRTPPTGVAARSVRDVSRIIP